MYMSLHPVVRQFGSIWERFTNNKTVPVSAQINLTNICFSSCQSCQKKTWPQVEIPLNKVLSIIDELSSLGCESILLSGGEVFSYINLATVIQAATNKGIKVGLLTSGIIHKLFIPSDLKSIFEKVFWVKVSIDSADNKRFHEIRGINALQEVIKNIGLMREINPNLKIRNNATISSLNAKEFIPLMKLGKSLGIETHFYPVHTHEGLLLTYDEIEDYYSTVELIRSAYMNKSLVQIREYVESKTNFFQFGNLLKRKKPKMCFIPTSHIIIDADGEVFYCCRTLNDNDEFSKRDLQYSIGNALQFQINKLLSGEKAETVRQLLFCANEDACNQCDRYNYVNELFTSFVDIRNNNTPTFL